MWSWEDSQKNHQQSHFADAAPVTGFSSQNAKFISCLADVGLPVDEPYVLLAIMMTTHTIGNHKQVAPTSPDLRCFLYEL